jgi:hypothetical protein
MMKVTQEPATAEEPAEIDLGAAAMLIRIE